MLKLNVDKNKDKNINKKDMLLYVVTDRTWLFENILADQVLDCIKAGATFIQMREKDLDFNSFVLEAIKIKEVTDKYKIPFVINDNIDVMIAVNADGVHIGQKDIEASDCRKLIGPNKILGVSAQTVSQALQAEKDGADYIGVGAVFSTDTKKDADTVSFETLKKICDAVSIPVVAIGGIQQNNILQLKESGIDGVAVISAVFSSSDIFTATQNLFRLAKNII